ncbi:C-reactive protein-like isoform X2 [Nematostella vectensis]|uniref:C-reactive protein-like isoform X2 n=1 Tax=Nematostella vectensis TaxID=45351 RepID=UPI0020774DDD|nr:C-reactive protein-like isoform X2 [Nematostella vectensis]
MVENKRTPPSKKKDGREQREQRTTCVNKATRVGCVLYFPSIKTSNFIQLVNPFTTTLGAFSVSVWLKIGANVNVDPVMIFSYATSSTAESLSVGIKKDGVSEIKFAGTGVAIPSGFNRDNIWQHLVFMYGHGKFKLYKNKVEQGHKDSDISSGSFDTQGTLMIGQYQGSVGGGFDQSKLFYDYMANFNIWDYAINQTIIDAVYAQGCTGSFFATPILSWGQITSRPISGDIMADCALRC